MLEIYPLKMSYRHYDSGQRTRKHEGAVDHSHNVGYRSMDLQQHVLPSSFHSARGCLSTDLDRLCRVDPSVPIYYPLTNSNQGVRKETADRGSEP